MASSTAIGTRVRGNGDRRLRPADNGRRDFSRSQVRTVNGAGEILSLAPCGSGWQLVTDAGRVTFSAEGRDARATCLRRAYESGVLCLR